MDSIPDDVLFIILSYLSINQLGKISCINKKFSIIGDDDKIWIEQAKVFGLKYTKRVHNHNLLPFLLI